MTDGKLAKMLCLTNFVKFQLLGFFQKSTLNKVFIQQLSKTAKYKSTYLHSYPHMEVTASERTVPHPSQPGPARYDKPYLPPTPHITSWLSSYLEGAGGQGHEGRVLKVPCSLSRASCSPVLSLSLLLCEMGTTTVPASWLVFRVVNELNL